MSHDKQSSLCPPTDYETRNYFPFGLSPIPEVPSELASENSSICPSPSPALYEDNDEEEESDTEVESVQSGLMYSGSCSSIKSNKTLADDEEQDEKDSDIDEEEEKTESDEEEEYEDEIEEEEEVQDTEVAKTQHDPSVKEDCTDEHCADERQGQDGDEEVVLDASQLEGMSGAETASEIFRHLQATHDKEEVTTELAKILNVLETTLKSKEKNEEDSSDSEAERVFGANNAVIKKPPKHPNAKAKLVLPQASRHGGSKKGRDELSILSKILVTLLCSCKTVAAAAELKKIIRQFREAASEATDEVAEELVSTSGRSSRSRSLKVRRSSGSSNASHSEAESLTNTLTPNNTDSKSSEDESNMPNNMELTSKLKYNVVMDNECELSSTPAISVTITLPRRPSDPDAVEMIGESLKGNVEIPNHADEDEEWSAEEEDTIGSIMESPKTKRLKQMIRNDSTSSDSTRDLSSSEGKSDTTRRLLSDMECGAYNSDSLNSPGHTSNLSDIPTSEHSHASPSNDESGWTTDESSNPGENNRIVAPKSAMSRNKEAVKKLLVEEVEGRLLNHLEETFKVLNGAFKIITGSQQNSDEETEEKNEKGLKEDVVSIVQENISRPDSPIVRPLSKTGKRPYSPAVRTITQQGERPSSRNISRPNSRLRNAVENKGPKALSRPTSRIQSRPVSRQTVTEGDNQEWEDDEWEYYYEDEDENNAQQEGVEEKSQQPVHPVKVEQKPEIEQIPKQPEPRPPSQQKRILTPKPGSRPGSRTGSRPTSRCSRMGRRTPLKNIGEDEEDYDWEWEYYDEEEEELQRLSPAITTAPTTRATSPFPNNLCEFGKTGNVFPNTCSEDNFSQIQKKTKSNLKPIEVTVIDLTSPSAEWEEIEREVPTLKTDDMIGTASEQVHSEQILSRITEVSVALAAEYLGQKKSKVKASLPSKFYDKEEQKESTKQAKKHKKSKKKKKDEKKRKRSKSRDDSAEEGRKYLPRLGVKDLVSRLEPKLFKDKESGTKMVMSNTAAKNAIMESKKNKQEIEIPASGPDGKKRRSVKDLVKQLSSKPSTVDDNPKTDFVDPMDAKNVGRVVENLEALSAPPVPPPLPCQSAPTIKAIQNNQVVVTQGSQSTVVQMRDKSKHLGARRKEVQQPPKIKPTPKPVSPEASEAYGTGSSASSASDPEQPELPKQNISNNDHEEEAKPHNRHSRLFRLLQDSDYTDSESTASDERQESGASIKAPGTNLFVSRESDMDTTSSLSRKHSFRSVQSSGKESDCDSISMTSSIDPYKLASPKLLPRHLKAKTTPGMPPASVETSNPNSPNQIDQMRRIKEQPTPRQAPTRVWDYLQEEFDPLYLETSEDSSYQSLSLHSNESLPLIKPCDEKTATQRFPLLRQDSVRSMVSEVKKSLLSVKSPRMNQDLKSLSQFPDQHSYFQK